MPDPIVRAKGPFDSDNDGQKTLHFFDDWPKSLQETNNGASSVASATTLSISTPENPSSDFSLKLGTGDGGEPSERDKPQLNWGVTWGANPVASMGGPLAEVLRSSTSNSSLTSVLYRNPRRVPASDASF